MVKKAKVTKKVTATKNTKPVVKSKKVAVKKVKPAAKTAVTVTNHAKPATTRAATNAKPAVTSESKKTVSQKTKSAAKSKRSAGTSAKPAVKTTKSVQKPVGKAKVRKVMKEFKGGELHSGSKTGPKVKDRKQAIAIALSEGRKAESGKSKTKKTSVRKK